MRLAFYIIWICIDKIHIFRKENWYIQQQATLQNNSPHSNSWSTTRKTRETMLSTPGRNSSNYTAPSRPGAKKRMNSWISPWHLQAWARLSYVSRITPLPSNPSRMWTKVWRKCRVYWWKSLVWEVQVTCLTRKVMLRRTKQRLRVIWWKEMLCSRFDFYLFDLDLFYLLLTARPLEATRGNTVEGKGRLPEL